MTPSASVVPSWLRRAAWYAALLLAAGIVGVLTVEAPPSFLYQGF